MQTTWPCRVLFFCLAIAATVSAARAQEIAFTWDDLPAHSSLPPGETRVEIGRKLLAAMKDAHLLPVYGFVNGVHTEREPKSTPMLKDWRDAGMLLGNHTWSHLNLNEHPLDAWKAEVLKNESLLKSAMGSEDWHWLRYPNLGEGETPEKRDAARRFLAEHGYKIAAVTMSFHDYRFNSPYARCVAKKDTATITQMEAAYLADAGTALDYSRELAKTLYGHDIPYVLLMHVGAFDARMLPRLLQFYRDKGVHFVRLEDAEKDPFYRNDLDLSLPARPDTLEEAMRAKGLPLPPRPASAFPSENVCK